MIKIDFVFCLVKRDSKLNFCKGNLVDFPYIDFVIRIIRGESRV